MAMTSLGDLAQSILLRRSVTATQITINEAVRDLSTGQAGDAAAHLRGHTASLTAIDSSLARNASLEQGLQRAGMRAEVMQIALSRIDDTATDAAKALMTASQTNNLSTLRTASRLATDALATVLSTLNQQVAGESVFAGTATDQPAIAPVAEVLASARAAVAGALSAADAGHRLDNWFIAPGGFPSLVTASREPITIPVGTDDTISLDVTSQDPLLQPTLKGLILGSLLGDATFANSLPAMAELAHRSAETLYAAAEPRAELASRLGLAEARIEQATTRIRSESGALGIARNDLLSIDSFETATRLTDAEMRMEQLYAITARLARLSLTEYMR